MVESGRGTERFVYEEGKDGGSVSQGLGFGRDPSFSGWCDEDKIFNSDDQEEDASAAVSELNFVLPLLQKGGLENGLLEEQQDEYSKFNQSGLHVNGSNSMEAVSTPVKRNASEKHATFDIEYAPERELDVSDSPYSDTDSVDKLEASPHDPKNPISIADVLRTLFFILVWYTFSTFLTLYNKTLLGDDMGRFPAPLLMNTVHFAMQAILSNAITFFWSQRFPTIVPMSWRDYFMRVVPTALGTAMDINLSNASLVFISVTFATMCKSASPIFLLIFAFAFRLESPSVRLLGIILIISAGILLTVARETEFDFWGFIFVMLAAVMSGFRWSMTQILLQKEVYGLKNPLTLMSYVTPVMAIATALFSFIMDPWEDFKHSNYFNTSWHTMRSCLLMLFGGTLAFFMVLTEYILVSVTSAVTVTIAGVVKEAVTILVAVFYFHDEFTWLKGAGLITIMFGVSLFNWYKYQKLHKRKSSQDDLTASPTSDVAAKYVILEEMDDEVDVP